MAPVIQELRRRKGAEVTILSTAQHRHMVDPLLAFFGLEPDIDLDAMTEGQTLPELTSRLLLRLCAALETSPPEVLLAQGDTTTVMAAAMACLYSDVPFAHVEAGLRTGNLRQPFPEEFNRMVATDVAVLNFAPTAASRENLLKAGVPAHRVVMTGNTVIDALLWTVARKPPCPIELHGGQRLLLMTLHRRESFGAPIRAVLAAVRTLVERNPDLVVLYPVHPNPNVKAPAYELLGDMDRVHLCEPMEYPQLVGAMQRAYVVLTDSGGIQEEAPALSKPVLVTREVTERPEAVHEGVALMVGTDYERIVTEVQTLLDDPVAYRRMARGASPYGDGRARVRIADAILSLGGRQ
jgi:UDP-N-acetylglucosamine 2-epimerase (non-hydrolysing)